MHISHSAEDWLKKSKLNILERLSQIPVVVPNFLLLWKDLNRAVHVRKSTHIPDRNSLKFLQTDQQFLEMFGCSCCTRLSQQKEKLHILHDHYPQQ